MRTNNISYELVPLRLPNPMSSGWLVDTSKDPIPVSRGLTVGRSEENTLRLDSLHVSRQHAVLKPTKQGLLVTNLSQNGTFYASDCSSKAINRGVKIAGQRYFHHNDVIVFPGSCPFKVSTVPGECGEDELRAIDHLTVQTPPHKYELMLCSRGKKKSICFSDDELVVNRELLCSKGIDDPGIDKKKHCTISSKDGGLIIQTNLGDIKVNGRDAVRVGLQEGDVVSIGNLVFRLRRL